MKYSIVKDYNSHIQYIHLPNNFINNLTYTINDYNLGAEKIPINNRNSIGKYKKG